MWILRRLLNPVRRFLERRRFPTLLLITAGLFLASVLIPDPLPFIDELLLLAGTVVLGSFRRRTATRDEDKGEDGAESGGRR